ncbi:MAG: hypothetical protein Q9190_006159 [Brigantiaea leucoxantha]
MLKMCVSNLSEGWRASTALAGGGAMVDIGWHLLDTVIGLANVHSGGTPNIAYSRLFHVRNSQGYDCEDSAEVILTFPSTVSKMTAHLTVSRIGHRDEENLVITGKEGVLTFDGNEVCVHFEPAAGKERLCYNPSQASNYQSDIETTFMEFYQQVQEAITGLILGSGEVYQAYYTHQDQDLIVTQTLQAIYKYAKHQRIEKHQDLTDAPLVKSLARNACDPAQDLVMMWPVIDQTVDNAVLTQLLDDISIYGNGGIFEHFETEFKKYHAASSSYTLLHNSGTNALHALYFAAGLIPGDEVIFPVYTFHATCSPAMHFGITPVFCDVVENGTISASAIASAITTKTKVVVVTHMWGIPCNMDAIRSVLRQWPRVLLLEDCSHAHGAAFRGQLVGTFGDGAAWSLQDQKIVSGGEGGITLTKHADFHYRQLLFGHYNKRCKLQIPPDHHLYHFSLTGAGLKNRAHPLAIAIALSQLRQLSVFHKFKTEYSSQILSKLSRIPFLDSPVSANESGTEPAWYALTIRFKAAKGPRGLTRETFVAELHSRGLVDVDIPRSTRLLHQQPLYNTPQELLPHVYSEYYSVRCNQLLFKEAEAFYNEAFKLPVYATEDGQEATDRYVRTVLEVVDRRTSQ